MPGPTELILILVIVLVVFGARRIPEIMGGVGKGIKDFKRAIDTDEPQPATLHASTPPASKNKAQTR